MKRIYVLLMMVSVLSSCGNFLEMKSPSEYVPKNIEALSEMLLGAAYPAPGVASDLFAVNTFISKDVQMFKDVIVADNYKLKLMSLKALYSWHPNVSEGAMIELTYVDSYSKYYQLILGCNAVFDYIDKVSGDVLEKNRVQAEAYTLRAFYYFHLVNLYAKPYSWGNLDAPGVPLKLTSNLESEPMKRNTVGEVYQQIESDLLKAHELFMTLPVNVRNVKSRRITLPVTRLMLTRMYLYMERWADVAKYAEMFMEEHISLQPYNLNDFMSGVKLTNGVPNKFPDFTDLANNETFWIYGTTASNNKYTINGSITLSKVTEVPVFGASEELRNSYEEGDCRKILYFVRMWDKVTRMPIVRDMYYPFGKTEITSNGHTQVSGDGKFAFSMRSSELYLNYAEALANMGGSSEEKAVNIIDKLRSNRIDPEKFTSISGKTGDELIKYVRAERRRELCFELHSWYDERRWNEGYSKEWYEGGVLEDEFKVEKNSPAFVLQIPAPALTNNTALVQNEKPQAQY